MKITFTGALRLFLKLNWKKRLFGSCVHSITPDTQGDVSDYLEKVSEIKNSPRIIRSFLERIFRCLAIICFYNIGNWFRTLNIVVQFFCLF